MGARAPATAPSKPAVAQLRVLPLKASGRRLLLLHPRPASSAGIHQVCTYFPVPGQGVAQRARVGQTPSRPRRHRVHERCRTDSPPAISPSPCRRSATASPPRDVQAFFDRWIADDPDTPHRATIALPATGGSSRCARSRSPARWCSTTLAAPASFFEALVADNIDIGRPEEVRSCSLATCAARPSIRYHTRIFSTGTEVRIDFRYKHSRVKHTSKTAARCASRRSSTNPQTSTSSPASQHLPELIDKARARQPPSAYDRASRPELCHRLCALRAHPPALPPRGPTNRSSALRRSHALWPWPALSATVLSAVTGFTTRASRARRRTPRPTTTAKPDELRPPPTAPARTHPTPPPQETPTPSPPKASASPSSTQAPNRLPTPTRRRQTTRHSTSAAPSDTLEHAVSDYIYTARLAPHMKLVTTHDFVLQLELLRCPRLRPKLMSPSVLSFIRAC